MKLYLPLTEISVHEASCILSPPPPPPLFFPLRLSKQTGTLQFSSFKLKKVHFHREVFSVSFPLRVLQEWSHILKPCFKPQHILYLWNVLLKPVQLLHHSAEGIGFTAHTTIMITSLVHYMDISNALSMIIKQYRCSLQEIKGVMDALHSV